MPFGQSVPVASPIAAMAGLIGSEIARAVVKEMDGGELAQRLATGIVHALTSATAGYVVNAALGVDVTGAAVTTGQTALTATAHGLLAGAHHSAFDVFLHPR